MAAFIARNSAIPDNQFSCPSNASGIEYASIPWSNMSSLVFYDPPAAPDVEEEAICGVKGPHPQMYFCCKQGDIGDVVNYDFSNIALAEEDHCSQYCDYFGNLNLWIWCLTREGDTVSNAFCLSADKEYADTSGTENRSGPFDPDSQQIKDVKKQIKNLPNPASASRTSMKWAWLAAGVVSVLVFAQVGV